MRQYLPCFRYFCLSQSNSTQIPVNPNDSDNNIIITRLTALWALNESGLGGIMFALHIPLTGFFVGGFAVILISLIAFYSKNNFRQILQATVLVLIIKATASPHAPPPAYIAVAFQGVVGAILFSGIRNHKIAALLLAVLAMAESSLQKVIVMTFIYGKSIWEALDKFLEGIGKDFSIHPNISYSYLVILIYVGVHVVWGIMLGIFAGNLPALMAQHAASVLKIYRSGYAEKNELMKDPIVKRKNKFWLRFVLILLFVVAVFLFNDAYSGSKILYAVIRSVAAVLLLFFVLRPLLQWAIQRWLTRQSSTTRLRAAHIMTMMPGMRSYVKPSWQMAGSNPSKMGKLRYFILSIIILSLYGE